MVRYQMSAILPLILSCCVTPGTLEAQVQLHPSRVSPAAWERFALRVVNQTDTATVAVRVSIPEKVAVLGVEPLEGWAFEIIPATDSTPQAVEWSGDSLLAGEFREFAFLGRLAGDAQKRELVFPVRLTKANGSVVEWTRGRRGAGLPPVVNVVGGAAITVWGAVGLAGGAVGIAILALALAIAARKSHR
jgi:uncharacterized protein YcnI